MANGFNFDGTNIVANNSIQGTASFAATSSFIAPLSQSLVIFSGSFIQGAFTTASGLFSHAQGSGSRATGNYSNAEG